MVEDDIYQQRYQDHIARKRRTISMEIGSPSFWGVLSSRHSQRTFNEKVVETWEMARLYEAICLAPSSCNRQAILIQALWNPRDCIMLERLLVGGSDWLFSASIILLLFADMRAYKSPAEIDFMPWLDAGFVAENVYLAAEALGLGCCYVNPNIREQNIASFNETFNPLGFRFCGALALGHYDVRGPESPKRPIEDIFYPRDKG